MYPNKEAMQERETGAEGRLAGKVVTLGGLNSDHIMSIIEVNAPVPLSWEVTEAIHAYAKGNPGVAVVLSKHAACLKTAADVEELVGWPLSVHTIERTGDIWDKLKNS